MNERQAWKTEVSYGGMEARDRVSSSNRIIIMLTAITIILISTHDICISYVFVFLFFKVAFNGCSIVLITPMTITRTNTATTVNCLKDSSRKQMQEPPTSISGNKNNGLPMSTVDFP